MDPYKQQQKEPAGGSQKQQQQQLAPILQEKVDNEQLESEYKQLIDFKLNQQKLQTILKIETDESQIKELAQMEKELQEATLQQEEKIKQSQNQSDYYLYNTEIIGTKHIGRLAKVQYDKNNKWYHAAIVNVEEDEQQISIQFIGYKEVIQVHSIFVKLMNKPDSKLFTEGTKCECIYSDDGRYHPCTIERVLDGEKYIVKYDKKEIKEQVTICYLREAKKNQNQGLKKRTFDDLTEFKVPDNLKILPNDNEKQKEQKKKKIKALKQQFKQAQIEQDAKKKQNSWQDFKKAKKQNTHSIFSTSDRLGSKVGVMNSGKGMTGFGLKERLKLEDNSHLSRQF